MRLTYPTTLVLQALLQGHHHGFDIMDATGLPSGTVYPILRRLDAEGCVRSRWEKDGVARREQRPPRRYYELTPERPHLRRRSGRPLPRAPGRHRRGHGEGEVTPMSLPRHFRARASHRRARRPRWCPPASATTGSAEWDAELASLDDVPARYRRPVRRALGAFADAFWLRQRSIADFDWIDDVRHGVRQLAQHGGFAVDRHRHPRAGPGRHGHDVQRDRPDPAAAAALSRRRSHRHGVGNARADRRAARGRARQSPRLARARARRSSTSPASSRGRSTSPATRGPRCGSPPRSPRDSSRRSASRRWPAASSRRRSIRRAAIACSSSARRSGGSASAAIRRSSARTVRADDGAFTIVGIVPGDVRAASACRPRAAIATSGSPRRSRRTSRNIRGSGYWAVVGRLKPGVTLEAAQAEMNAIAQQLARSIRAPTRRPARACSRFATISSATSARRHAARRRGARRAAHRLRQRRQPAAGARLGARARDRRARRRSARGAAASCSNCCSKAWSSPRSAGWSAPVLAAWALRRAGASSARRRVPWIETLHLDWRALAFAASDVGDRGASLSGMLPGVARGARRARHRRPQHHDRRSRAASAARRPGRRRSRARAGARVGRGAAAPQLRRA